MPGEIAVRVEDTKVRYLAERDTSLPSRLAQQVSRSENGRPVVVLVVKNWWHGSLHVPTALTRAPGSRARNGDAEPGLADEGFDAALDLGEEIDDLDSLRARDSARELSELVEEEVLELTTAHVMLYYSME